MRRQIQSVPPFPVALPVTQVVIGYSFSGAAAAINALDKDGNSFDVGVDVLDKDGNSFTVTNDVLDKDGNSFTVN